MNRRHVFTIAKDLWEACDSTEVRETARAMREIVFVDRGSDLIGFVCADGDGTRPIVTTDVGRVA